MEAFSLLKYWKGNAGVRKVVNNNAKLSAATSNAGLMQTTIVSAVESRDAAVDEDSDCGPFFDLEFAVDADTEEEEERQKVEERDTENGIANTCVKPSSISNVEETSWDDEIDKEEDVEQNLCFSPSDDLFFKGKVIQLDGSESAPLSEMEEIITAAASSKSGQLTLPVSLVKSATKLRVLMLGLKRSKSDGKKIDGRKNSSKFMTVRLKMENMKVPKISLLPRAHSNTAEDDKSVAESSIEENNEEEKKDLKEVVQRYLKLVRPLYVKASRRADCGTVLVAGDDEVKEATIGPVKSGKARLNLKVITKKHLRKSKSAVVHTMPSNNNSTTSSKKSDDSLLQQQDGIQSAILHCKRSFNSSTSSEDAEETMAVMMRSGSESSYEKKCALQAEEMVEQHEENGVVAR